MSTYRIGPSIGIARVGNSPDSFYLAPEETCGLPLECDAGGNALGSVVKRFKDAQGRIRRQAARFTVFRFDEAEDPGTEITAADVQSMEWQVHLANKKACWYNFAELQGNLLYGEQNSYANQCIPLRNAGETAMDKRRALIIDPGPRTLHGTNQKVSFSKDTVPPGYKFASFPPQVTSGEQITTLGEAMTDREGRLLVLGGFGNSGGDQPIQSFAGADTWHDDISDGQIHCSLMLKTGETVKLEAWCIVGSPKFVPEIANIVSLQDTMFDVAVRELGTAPTIYKNGAYNSDYRPNFERDIRPILERPGAYRWVANVPSMNSVSPAPFDARDKSTATAELRAAYLGLFRKPDPTTGIDPESNELFSSDSDRGGFPLMPLNSGSNSVSNGESNCDKAKPNKSLLVDKFLSLTETQYFFLSQWAKGMFDTSSPQVPDRVLQLTEGSVGNCVGGPFCPGIEVTWSTRNPNIYQGLYVIRPRHDEAWYAAHGLDPNEDETADRLGCEPGDLTKRMAIPWQADFFQCSIQFINFTNPSVNQNSSNIPVPPTYYAYWWPPQSPWQVITGDLTSEGQAAAGTPAGYQVLYSRGINTFSQMVTSWYYMGFVVNQATSRFRTLMPYFTEQERNHSAFIAAAVAVGDASNVTTGQDTNFSNMWFLPPTPAPTHTHSETLAPSARPAAASVLVTTSRRQGRQPGVARPK